MNNITKFKFGFAESKDEKLIVELILLLDKTAVTFVREKDTKNLSYGHDFFCILRDASMGYFFSTLEELTKMLMDKDQVPLFIKENEDMMQAYIKQLKDNY